MEEGSPAKALMILRESGRQKTSPRPMSIAIRPSTRSRKRSRLSYSGQSPDHDDLQEEEEWITSPKLGQRRKTTPSKALPSGNLFTFAQKRVMKGLMAKLQNMLRQSNARKFVYYEWFYSNIDRALFGGENDFSICLKEHFPDLKTRQLSRAQWGILRRLMGKPRRCSPAFFKEERDALETKRVKIRHLLQRKNLESSDSSSFKDLPEEIPLPIVIGTKVTARLRTKHHDGLFTGQVDAVDTFHDTYRISFDREGIGTHSIADIEVMSHEGHETITLSSLVVKDRSKYFLGTSAQPRVMSTNSSQDQLNNGDSLDASPPKIDFEETMSKNGSDDATYGGFPIKFLIQVTRLSKMLTRKRSQIKSLRELNQIAERLKSYEQPYSRDFQQQYAAVVLELELINKELDDCLRNVQGFCQKLSPEIDPTCADTNATMRSLCYTEARQLIDDNPRSSSINNDRIKELVTGLTSLMLQVKNLASHNMKSFELTSISEAIKDIKLKLHPSNKSTFFEKVEVNIAHIESGLSQMGNVNAFQSNSSTIPLT